MKPLPDGELTVMTALWDAENCASAEEIAALLPEERAWNRTTLLTMLSRLAAKRFIRVEKTGRSNQYTALITREAYMKSAGAGLISRLCAGSITDFVAAMCDSRNVSEDEIKKLRAYLDTLSRGEK